MHIPSRALFTAALALGALAASVPSASAQSASVPGGPSASARAATTQADPLAPRYVYGRVTSSTITVRSRPTTHSAAKGIYKRGYRLQIECWTRGQAIHGDRTWYKLGPRNQNWHGVGYVAGHYVRLLGARPVRCR
ncbi:MULTISPECIES: hypothetical protein [Actinomadura]|uniref:SH3 domain-containing protein n=1 Tax=Actinomadura yumaensis TaxID=111807 RepID=A0ABW2D1U3_9ACTN|nr:hypothetical protein [Actinomadura sp. J1-007]MWK39319.1 hypothetical protein [Actinomadura sp. J1-007]